MPNYPASAPALSEAYADGTTSATNHAAAHNTVNDEVNAIGLDLVNAAQGAAGIEALVKGRDVKVSVRAASTANVTISPGGASLVMDGITLVNGDRVFLKDQTAPAENGVYVVGGVGSSVTLTRSADANASAYMTDATLIMVEQGAVAADTAWELVSDNPITLGTTPLYWTRVWPDYEANGPRNPWSPTGTVMQNFPRERWTTTAALPTAATWVFMGGGVLPAGKLITNVNVWWSTVGSGYTIRHFSLVRASDRVVLQRTANSTTVPTANALLTAALQATYTPPTDIPIYLVLGIASTGAGGITTLAPVVTAALVGTQAPPLAFTTTTGAPTTTPPTVGATVGAASGTALVAPGGYYLT